MYFFLSQKTCFRKGVPTQKKQHTRFSKKNKRLFFADPLFQSCFFLNKKKQQLHFFFACSFIYLVFHKIKRHFSVCFTWNKKTAEQQQLLHQFVFWFFSASKQKGLFKKRKKKKHLDNRKAQHVKILLKFWHGPSWAKGKSFFFPKRQLVKG